MKFTAAAAKKSFQPSLSDSHDDGGWTPLVLLAKRNRKGAFSNCACNHNTNRLSNAIMSSGTTVQAPVTSTNPSANGMTVSVPFNGNTARVACDGTCGAVSGAANLSLDDAIVADRFFARTSGRIANSATTIHCHHGNREGVAANANILPDGNCGRGIPHAANRAWDAAPVAHGSDDLFDGSGGFGSVHGGPRAANQGLAGALVAKRSLPSASGGATANTSFDGSGVVRGGIDDAANQWEDVVSVTNRSFVDASGGIGPTANLLFDGTGAAGTRVTKSNQKMPIASLDHRNCETAPSDFPLTSDALSAGEERTLNSRFLDDDCSMYTYSDGDSHILYSEDLDPFRQSNIPVEEVSSDDDVVVLCVKQPGYTDVPSYVYAESSDDELVMSRHRKKLKAHQPHHRFSDTAATSAKVPTVGTGGTTMKQSLTHPGKIPSTSAGGTATPATINSNGSVDPVPCSKQRDSMDQTSSDTTTTMCLDGWDLFHDLIAPHNDQNVTPKPKPLVETVVDSEWDLCDQPIPLDVTCPKGAGDAPTGEHNVDTKCTARSQVGGGNVTHKGDTNDGARAPGVNQAGIASSPDDETCLTTRADMIAGPTSSTDNVDLKGKPTAEGFDHTKTNEKPNTSLAKDHTRKSVDLKGKPTAEGFDHTKTNEKPNTSLAKDHTRKSVDFSANDLGCPQSCLDANGAAEETTGMKCANTPEKPIFSSSGSSKGDDNHSMGGDQPTPAGPSAEVLKRRIPRKTTKCTVYEQKRKGKDQPDLFFDPNLKYPVSHHLHSISEIHEFCVDISKDPEFAHLLEDNIYNLCLVMEEPTEAYRLANSSNRLDNLGRCASERWECVNTIHVVIQSPRQAYLAANAEGCHYQDRFWRILKSLQNYNGPLELLVYFPNQNYANNFLMVLNTNCNEYMDIINWDEVRALLDASRRESDDETHQGTQRQSVCQGYGFAGNQNTSREKSANGVSMPRLKPGYTQMAIRSILYAFSEMARKLQVPWLPQGQRAYHCPSYPQRHEIFARQVAEWNLIEAVHVSATTPSPSETADQTTQGDHMTNTDSIALTSSRAVDDSGLLAPHHDRLNPRSQSNPTMAVVMGLSVIHGEERVGCNCFGRQSIDDYFTRVRDLTPLLNGILSDFATIDRHRIVLDHSTLRMCRTIEYFPGVPCLRGLCHFDPSSYINCWADFIIRIALKFRLSMNEVVSLTCAFEKLPNTALYFGCASLSLLLFPRSGAGRFCGYRGAEFGRMFLKLCLAFKTRWDENVHRGRAGRNGEPDHRRFNMYRTPTLPSRDEWHDLVERRTKLSLLLWSVYGDEPNAKSRRIQVSKKVTEWVCSGAENTGAVTAMHYIKLATTIGTFPAWMSRYVHLDTNSHWAKWLAGHYRLNPLLRRANGLLQMADTVIDAILKRYGHVLTYTAFENVMCKHVRRLSSGGNDNRWGDIYFPGQNLYRPNNDNTYTIYVGSTSTYENHEGGLINRFPFGRELLTLREIANETGIPRAVPAKSRMYNFCLPRELSSPSIALETDFTVPPLPKLHGDGRSFLESVYYSQFPSDDLNDGVHRPRNAGRRRYEQYELP